MRPKLAAVSAEIETGEVAALEEEVMGTSAVSPEFKREATRPGERAVELRYMGFQQKQNRRIYRFDMNDAGTKSSIPHVVTVDMELFLKHHVGIQEGPALCAQKINADLVADRQGEHELTNEDIMAYASDRAVAAERKAEARRSGPARRKPEPGQPVSPWWR